MDDLEFNDDLHELHVLVDRIMAALDPSPVGEVLITIGEAYNPTIYSQCGHKPRWPYFASDTFADVWSSR